MPTTEAVSPPLIATEPSPARLPLFVALLTLLAAYLRFGYGYGAGDHDELVPSVLHLLDGALFTQDWLVQTVTSGINVRTFFVWLAALPSFIVPPWLTFFVLWVAVFVAVCYGVYELAYEIVRDRLAAAVGVFVACVLTVRWTLGSNAVVYDTLVPEGVAWALAVPAITLSLRRRWVWAGILLGLATWFHLLVGVHLALVLGIVGLGRAVARVELDGKQLRSDFVSLARFGGVFVLVALPILTPVLLEQIRSGPASVVPAFYIHAQFRNPHHLLFSTFEAGHHLRFWPVVLAGIGSGWWLSRRDMLRHGRALAVGGLFIAGLCALAVVLGEHVPVAFVAKLQFFKLTVVVTLLASLIATAAAVQLLPSALREMGERLLAHRRSGLIAAVILVGLTGWLAMANVSRPGALLHPLRHLDAPLGEVERWAEASTPRDALFAIPPSVSTFRSHARRAVVADFTGFVFTEAAMRQWFERLMDVAPIEPPPLGVGVKPELDAAYRQQPAAAWQHLQEGYGIDYVVMEPDAPRLPFEVAFEKEGWTVYQLPIPEPSPAAR